MPLDEKNKCNAKRDKIMTMLKAGSCFAALLLLDLGMASEGRAVSFDCAKAGTSVERLICSNPALSSLDDRMNTVFHEVAGPTPSPALLKVQNNWRRGRDRCSDVACVSNAYGQRIAVLGGAGSAQSLPALGGADHQGKFCILGTGTAYSMLLVRLATPTKLQFALTDWTPNGANFSVAGVANRNGSTFRYENNMTAADQTQRCAILFAPLGGGGYGVTLQANAACETMGGNGSIQYLADRFPGTARVGNAPPSPDMDALNHVSCDRFGH